MNNVKHTQITIFLGAQVKRLRRNYSLAAKLPDVIASGFNPRATAKIHHALKGRIMWHPFRMRFILIPRPGVETPGYNLPSLWDDENVLRLNPILKFLSRNLTGSAGTALRLFLPFSPRKGRRNVAKGANPWVLCIGMFNKPIAEDTENGEHRSTQSCRLGDRNRKASRRHDPVTAVSSQFSVSPRPCVSPSLCLRVFFGAT